MLKNKKYILKILIVSAIIISTIFAFSGCKKENKNQTNNDEKAYVQPITDYFEGIKNKELSRILKAFPDFMQMSEKITDEEINDLYKQYESIYGANIKIEYSVGDATALGEDEINDLEDNLLSIYTDQENIDITAAYIIPVTVTITGDGIVSDSSNENSENKEENSTIETDAEDSNESDNKEQEDMYVIQYNGNWYLM